MMPSIRERLPALVAELWGMCDAACARANAALAEAGTAARIAPRCSGPERQYSIGDPADPARFVRAFQFLPLRDCHVFGGIYITTSATRVAIYLVPWCAGTDGGWMVAATGTQFSPEMAHDLFAAAFGDGAAATERIRRLTGFDLFQTPWS